MSVQTDNKAHVRWMIRRDMNDVLAIENQSYTHAWTEDDFLRCLRQRNCIGMTAEQDDKIVGFAIYELRKSKVHVLNFAVAPFYRRAGVGTRIIAKLTEKLQQHQRSKLTLVVSERNLATQLWLRKRGFKAIKVLRDYYEETNGEDGYLMEYRKDECDEQSGT